MGFPTCGDHKSEVACSRESTPESWSLTIEEQQKSRRRFGNIGREVHSSIFVNHVTATPLSNGEFPKDVPAIRPQYSYAHA
jgi:hypothetical protein